MWRFGAALISVVCGVAGIVPVPAQSSGRGGVPSDSGAARSFSQAGKAGHLVYTTAMLPRDVRGDIAAQTREVFDALGDALKRAGSSLADVVSATVTIKRAEDQAQIDAAFRARFKTAPPARTVLVGELPRPGALVQIQAVAVPAGGSRRAIVPAGWTTPAGPENYAMQADDTVFMSGLVARDGASGRFVAGDAGAQVKVIMDNAGAILKAAGLNYDHLVSGRITVRDMATFDAVNAVYREYWQKDRPSRATVQGNIRGGGDVSITFVAVSAENREVIVQPRADGTAGVVGPNLSPAIKVGNRLFVSGNTGSTEPTAATSVDRRPRC